MHTLVVCAKDGAVVQRVPVGKGEWLIGRQDGNHVVLPSASVSRQHARIYTAQGRCFIQGLKSSNGVVIDGRRIAEVEELQPGQRVLIGDFLLYLQPEGVPEAPPPPAVSTHIVDQDRDFARLVGLTGPFEGEEFSLSERENTIGRTEDNLILLPDASVSRQHARIVADDRERHVLFDLHSSNGSYVNRKRVQRALLRDGDVASIGNVSFRFVDRRTGGRGPRTGAEGATRRSLLVLGLVSVLLLMAGATVGLVFYNAHQRRAAKQRAEEAHSRAVVDGRNAVTARDWETAVVQLGRAVDYDPTDREIKTLLDRARAEQAAKATADRGDRLAADGRLDAAIKAFSEVPNNSAYFPEVSQKLKKVKAALVEELSSEASALFRKRKYAECHEALVRALDLDPTDAELQKKIGKVERKLRKKHIAFERWQPPSR